MDTKIFTGLEASTRNALVVGANTSISATLIKGLNSAGVRVLATGRSRQPPIASDSMLQMAELDLLQRETFDMFTQNIVSNFGRLDIVLFLTGVLPGKSLSDYSDEMMDEVMMINFTAQAAFLRRLLPHLNQGSLVLMLSSISAERGSYDPIYAASKAAQIAFVKSLATWLAPNVRVNAIAPALIADSRMFANMSTERRAHHLAQTPTKKLTTMNEIAGIVVNLCSPAWSNVNGQVIRVNGGAYV